MTATFPKTACSLWDKAHTGAPVFLHLGSYRKPRICLPEKVLKLIQHQCEHYGQTSHVLVGTLVVEEDGEGMQFQVDRLDTREHIPPDGSGLAPGDLLIPLEVSNNKCKERTGTVDEYSNAIRRLQDRCCSKASIDLSSFVLLRGWGSFYSNAHTSVVHLDFDMVTMETVFKAIPVSPVPIVLTALSKNLSGPMSLSHMQGTPKTGFLTMDQTRKILLVLESDPKAATLPIIGIWVSGTEFVQHPFVWASCLRYIHCTHLEDRVCSPPEDFLLVLYTPLHSRPEFYQCVTTSGNKNFEFQLYSGHEVGNLTKSLSSHTDNFTEVEMEPVNNGHKMEIFDAAKDNHSKNPSSNNANISQNPSEDLEPRAAPTPHMEKVPVMRPMVPDVSIMWNDCPDLPPPQPTPPFKSGFSTSMACPQSSQSFQSQTAYQQQMVHGRQQQLLKGYSNHGALGSIQPSPSLHPSMRMQHYSMHPTSYGHRHPHISRMPIGQAPEAHISNHPPSHPGLYNTASQGFPQSMRQSHPNLPVPSIADSYRACLPMNQNSPMSQSTQPSPHTNLTASTQLTTQQLSHIQGSQIPPNMYRQGVVQHNTNAVPSSQTSVAAQSCPQMWRQEPARPMPSMAGNQTVPIQPQHLTHHNHPSVSQQIVSYSGNNFAQPQHNLPASQIPQRMQANNSNVVFTPAPVISSQSTAIQQYAPTSRSMIPVTAGNSSLQSHQSNASPRNPQTPMTFLKTVVEEPSSLSSSSSSRTTSDNQESRLDLSKTGRLSNVSAAQNSSGSSSRSSDDDSGLSVTPERLNPSPPEQQQQQHMSSSVTGQAVGPVVTASSGPALGPSLDSVKWDQVPPEIRALLIQQSEQLKQLQQQIQVLIQNQSQLSSTANSTQQCSLSQDSKCAVHQPNPSVEKHSIAVNTTFLDTSTSPMVEQQRISCDSRFMQTSPGKALQRESVEHAETFSEPQDLYDHDSSSKRHQHEIKSPLTNAEFCTSKERMLPSAVSCNSPNDEAIHRDLSAAVDNLNVYDQTFHTTMSDLVVDMPDYASSVANKSNFDQSPPSVSACYNPENESYSTVAEDATDPKQYYSQLMNNIQLFLANNGSQDGDLSKDRTESDDILHTPSRSNGADESAYIPEINYMSMMLAGCSDTGQSMEINAMAMKYLNDEQLTQMAKLQQMGKAEGGAQSNYTAKILQKVICGNGQTSSRVGTPDISHLGMSPNNLTMGTRKYMEKYGLLGNDTTMLGSCGGNDPSLFDYTFKLNTDFSIAVSGDMMTARTSEFGGSDADKSMNSYGQSSPVKSPIRKEILRDREEDSSDSSPEIESPLPERRKLYNVTNTKRVGKDLGASPALPPGKGYNSTPDAHLQKRGNVPGRKERLSNGVFSPQQLTSQSTESEDQEEENLLDIEKLKQLPKLL